MLSEPFLRATWISLLVGIAVGAAAALFEANQTWSNEQNELRRDALLSLDTVDLLLQKVRLGALTVATSVDPDDLAGSAEELWPLVERDLLDFRTIVVVDPSGIVVADERDGAPAVGSDVSDRSYFREIIDGNAASYFVSEPVVSRIDGNWSLPLSVPVLDADETLHGVVVASVGQDFFDPAEWRALGGDVKVYMALADSGSIIALNERAERAELQDVIATLLLDVDPQRDAASVTSFAIPGQVAFISTSTSGRVDVIVSRGVASLRRQAAWAGLIVGTLVAILVSAVTMVGLWGRETIRLIRRDAERLSRLEERQRLAADVAEIGVWDLNVQTDKLAWDPVMHKLYGTTPEHFSGTYAAWQACVHPDDLLEAEAAFQHALRTGEEFKHRFRIITPDGQERVMMGQAGIKSGADGRVNRVVGVNFDVTEEVARETALEAARHQIEYDAFHDPLTHVGNRRGVAHHIRMIQAQYAKSMPVALLVIDLDRFKYINDVFGHAGGDHLLSVVAGILTSEADASDYVARLGGDEFVTILTGVDAEPRATEMAERILEACRNPVQYQHRKINFSTSIGLCIGSVASALDSLEDADIALYEAKHDGRNRFQVFTPALRAHAEEKKLLADDLDDALKGDEIGVRLQPQICARTGRLAGAEALVRWWHPKRGELDPFQFLPLADEMGLLSAVDECVLHRSVEAAAKLESAGSLLPGLSVNVSFQRLTHPDFLRDVDRLPEHPCPITFELLETIDFDSVAEDVLMRIEMLRERGIRIALDDFGSGRASITTLLRVRPDRIKIDKQLVLNAVTSDGATSPLLQAIADMCQRLNIPMTAEGVETAESAIMMTKLGCDVLQGYYFAKPLTTDDFAEWARSRQVTV